MIALPETTAGCDVVCFLETADQKVCGALTIAGCRYVDSVRAEKQRDQEVKVHLRQQYLVRKRDEGTKDKKEKRRGKPKMEGVAREYHQKKPGRQIRKLIDSGVPHLTHFVELLVRRLLALTHTSASHVHAAQT